MTITELQKRIAEVLGVSSSEKELAFNILITKIAENLESDLTLKVPRIGFFQLKESDTNVKETLIFSPFSDEIKKISATLYLTIDIPRKIYRNEEKDSDVFSIGVGKPLLPLSGDLSPQTESETSYVILKRSIEERVNEIIAESDLLPNFNIWDDYYESLQSKNEIDESKSKLSELTSDIEFREDLIAEDITNNLLNIETEPVPVAASEVTPLLTATDLLEDFSTPITTEPDTTPQFELPEENEIAIEEQTRLDTVDIASKFSDDLNELIKDYEDEKLSELDFSKLKDIYIEPAKENKEHGKLDFSLEHEVEAQREDDSEENYLGLKKSNEEKIEWNWGDELKEELGSSIEEEKRFLFEFDDESEDFEEEPKSVEDIFKTSVPTKSRLFEQLENSIKKELSETESASDYFEYQTPPKYEFVEDRNTGYQPLSYSPHTRTSSGTDEQYYKELKEDSDKYFSRNFFLIFSAFIIIVSITVYMLLPNKNEPGNDAARNAVKTDSVQSEKLEASLPVDTTIIIPEDESDFPRVASLSVTDKNSKPDPRVKEKVVNEPIGVRTNESNPMYKKPAADTRITNTVYYDGKSYNVQVSSWRNKDKAEQEVIRLRGLGLNAFIFEAYLPQKGGTWYRVRIGNFKTVEEAKYFISRNNF
ncbi:MAG: SPOR domain-containing protein [Bacteroidota bacterium]|jgi:cell division septation protein DedD